MRWFHSVSAAMVKYGVKALLGAIPFAEVMVEVAGEVWKDYFGEHKQGNLPAELEAVAALSPDQVHQAVTAAVRQVAVNQPPEVQQRLGEYLAQSPHTIRRSLRRPSDPRGQTVPATLSFRQARDLVPMLPDSLPRYKTGDRPLPGVPLVLVELLGKGGFGEVWLAHHPRDDSLKTALKFCLDERAARSLRHEAKALARVRREGKHAGIVELRQVWDENEPICLEYEYVEGGDLSGLIRDLHAAGPPAPETVALWMLHLLEPIQHVHSLNPPLVHRDLKPGNILVERQKDGNDCLRIADFGISDVAAREALRDTMGRSMMTIGVGGYTALYASPQQIRGEAADPRDDVHALGVIWLQMLTGDINKGRPSGSGWKASLRGRGVSEAMLDLLEQCMDDEPSARPRDAGELTQRLQRLLAPFAPAKKPKPSPRSLVVPTLVQPIDDVEAMPRIQPAHNPLPEARPRRTEEEKGTGSSFLKVFVPMVLLPFLGLGAWLLIQFLLKQAEVSKAQNSLKLIAIAMHNYADSNSGILPAHAIYAKDLGNASGKPLLSWRVAILPYLEQGNLFNQIRQNEPWDSPHNRQFWYQMPKIYAMRGVKQPGMTSLQVFTGKDTLFPGASPGLKIGTLPDGTTNTILIAEGREAVNWMEPRDIDLNTPQEWITVRDRLANWDGRGFLVGLGDGSVRHLRPEISNATLKAAINPADGVTLGKDW